MTHVAAVAATAPRPPVVRRLVEKESTLRETVDALRGYLTETEGVDGKVASKYGALYMMVLYLAAEEVTVTVMPTGMYVLRGRLLQQLAQSSRWALPPVERTAHAGGIAPYNGVVAVTANSRVVPALRCDSAADAALAGMCTAVTAAVGAIPPIRIDARGVSRRWPSSKQDGGKSRPATRLWHRRRTRGSRSRSELVSGLFSRAPGGFRC